MPHTSAPLHRRTLQTTGHSEMRAAELEEKSLEGVPLVDFMPGGEASSHSIVLDACITLARPCK